MYQRYRYPGEGRREVHPGEGRTPQEHCVRANHRAGLESRDTHQPVILVTWYDIQLCFVRTVGHSKRNVFGLLAMKVDIL